MWPASQVVSSQGENKPPTGAITRIMQTNKQKPIHEVRLGAIKAAVWKNDTQNGVRYNTTFCRIYRDKDDNEWKTSESFGREDLLVLAKVADRAHSWIHEQGQEESKNDNFAKR